jgi:cation transport regulator ChaC
MKKVVRLTETELTNLIKKVVVESKKPQNKKRINEMENFINPEAMETADAIYTIIGTTIGLLGIAGYDYLKSMAQELMKQGKEKKAQKILDFVEANAPKGDEEMMDSEIDTEDEDDNFKPMAESIRRKTRKSQIR